LQRAKDIEIGKALPGYAKYIAAVPKQSRDRRRREHPTVSKKKYNIIKITIKLTITLLE
jgi:hypothetical protein